MVAFATAMGSIGLVLFFAPAINASFVWLPLLFSVFGGALLSNAASNIYNRRLKSVDWTAVFFSAIGLVYFFSPVINDAIGWLASLSYVLGGSVLVGALCVGYQELYNPDVTLGPEFSKGIIFGGISTACTLVVNYLTLPITIHLHVSGYVVAAVLGGLGGLVSNSISAGSLLARLVSCTEHWRSLDIWQESSSEI